MNQHGIQQGAWEVSRKSHFNQITRQAPESHHAEVPCTFNPLHVSTLRLCTVEGRQEVVSVPP